MRHFLLATIPALSSLSFACMQTDDPESQAGAPPALQVSALDGAPRTVPYGGYVDFDGEPVNAGSVAFNFALFPCATPGTGAGGCSAAWVAKGTWTDGADWMLGWPAGPESRIGLPVFSGRFTVELGGAGQNPIPDALLTDHEILYLAVQIEGRALGTLQKIVPALRSVTSIASSRSWPDEDFVVEARVVDTAGVQITIPSGAVVPFDLDVCPPGWTEYAAAYGRFVRGVDRSGNNLDPDGERAVGALQDDLLKSHSHSYIYMEGNNAVDGVDSATTNSGEHHNEPNTTGATGGAETRPKNVALLYCRKD